MLRTRALRAEHKSDSISVRLTTPILMRVCARLTAGVRRTLGAAAPIDRPLGRSFACSCGFVAAISARMRLRDDDDRREAWPLAR